MARLPRTLLLFGPPLSPRVACTLAAAGHEVQVGTMTTADELASAFRPDLVLIEVAADDPAAVGASVRRIHARCDALLVCLVDGPRQWVPALEAGADGYLQKPFSDHELEVAVRALVRRTPWMRDGQRQVGRLLVDDQAHMAWFDDQPLTLSRKEFGILSLLARHAGSVLSKRVLLEQLWGYDAYEENLVEVQVCGLRRHLPPAGRQLVRTVRGMGYVLREDAQVVSA